MILLSVIQSRYSTICLVENSPLFGSETFSFFELLFLDLPNFFLPFHFSKHSQTWANDHLQIAITCLKRPRFWDPIFKICQCTSEQRPPVNNGHNFGVPRVGRCTQVLLYYILKFFSSFSAIHLDQGSRITDFRPWL